MYPPRSTGELLHMVAKSRIVPENRLRSYLDTTKLPEDAHRAVMHLLRDGMLSGYQAKQIMDGRYRGMVINNYVVMERLNPSIGMAYLAMNTMNGQRCCLKLFSRDTRINHQAWFEFVGLSSNLIELDHPKLLKVLDVLTVEKLRGIVLEFFEGRNLEDILRSSGPLPWTQALQIAKQIGEGMEYAHGRQLYHGRLRSNRILLSVKGNVKIVEVGLAQCLRHTSGDKIHRTVPDPRADVFGLGITLQQMMQGLNSVSGTAPAYLPSIPPSLTRIINKMVSTNPKDRYPSMSSVMVALNSYQPLPTETRNAAYDAGTVVEKAMRTKKTAKLVTPMFN